MQEPTLTDHELVAQMATARAERLRKGWGGWAPRNPNASDLHDCRRYLVMRQIAWQVRDVPPASALEVIENGNVQEPAMIRQLQDEGWEIVEQQGPFQIRQPVPGPGGPMKVIVSGRIDGKLRLGREAMPFDTKDTSSYVEDSLDTEADLQRSLWTRKWWRQLQIYLLGENAERGILLLGHRGHRTPIIVHLDLGAAEELLQRCTWAVATVEELEGQGVTHDTVDEALAARGVPYHEKPEDCRTCPFFQRACFPPQPAPGTAQIRGDLEDLVARYVAAKPKAAEAEKLKKQIQAATQGFDSTVAGRFVIEGDWKSRKVKAAPAREDRWWGFDVRAVEPPTPEEAPAP